MQSNCSRRGFSSGKRLFADLPVPSRRLDRLYRISAQRLTLKPVTVMTGEFLSSVEHGASGICFHQLCVTVQANVPPDTAAVVCETSYKVKELFAAEPFTSVGEASPLAPCSVQPVTL
jgi:hypothetical protein